MILMSARLVNDWQFDEAGIAGRVIDPLCCFLVVLHLREENVANERLRIAVVQREPSGLDLHHDAMSWKENMVRMGQPEFIKERLTRRDRFRGFKTFAISAAKDVRGHH